jgi:hypothetical protein
MSKTAGICIENVAENWLRKLPKSNETGHGLLAFGIQNVAENWLRKLPKRNETGHGLLAFGESSNTS